MSIDGFKEAATEASAAKQRATLRKAIRWEIFTIVYTLITITVVAFVLGSSQAMKTAWIEDMLSLIPQVAFLIALIFIRRKPTKRHPYGMHRATGIGHLVAGLALLTVGFNLAFEAISGLIRGDRAEIGDVVIFGQTIWFGWVMVAVMLVIVIGPVFLYGPAKARLAPKLHNKLLYADADMANADWQTNAASIVGVLGIGLGLWWLDGVAALFISLGIVWDGYRNTKMAVLDLMDQRALTYDGKHAHPLGRAVVDYLAAQDWIEEAAIRMRDQGQVFHVEAFVHPKNEQVTLEQIGEIAEGIEALDWKIQDVVIVPTGNLPEHADRGLPDDD